MRLLIILLCLLSVSEVETTTTSNTLMVGKWKVKRKIAEQGPNRCYVDAVSFYENDQFELVFKTLIANKERTFTYTGEVDQDGDATLVLGDGIAQLKGFNRIEDKVDFRFEYGEKLGMFCAQDKHPFPHKHLPHDLVGEKID